MGSILVIALSVTSTLAAGLASDVDQIRRVLRTRLTWLVLAGNLVVVPLLAWIVMPALVSGPAAIGLVLVAAAPGGGIGPLLAILGRGEASLAGALFLVLSTAGTASTLVVTLVLDPPIAALLRAASLVSVTALAPLVLGLIVGRVAPHVARGTVSWISRLGAVLLVSTVAWFSIVRGGQLSAAMLGAAAVVALASGLVGWLATRLAGMPSTRSITISVVEISLVRNVALTLVVVTALGADRDAITSVLTYALVMLAAGGLLAAQSAARTASAIARP